MARPIALIVEDNREYTMIATRLLENEGFEVVAAGDGETGIAQARARRPEVILLDLSLPGIDGFDSLHCIQAADQLATVRINGPPLSVLASRSPKLRLQLLLRLLCLFQQSFNRRVVHVCSVCIQDGEPAEAAGHQGEGFLQSVPLLSTAVCWPVESSEKSSPSRS